MLPRVLIVLATGLCTWSQIRSATAATDITDSPQDSSLFPGLAVSFSTGPAKWHNVTYSLSDFTASGGGADGPWTLTNAEIHAVITKVAGGRF